MLTYTAGEFIFFQATENQLADGLPRMITIERD
jgi:hypothetical protein